MGVEFTVNILKWLTVMALSMLKFVGGPLAGLAFKLPIAETIIFTILGMMLSVLIVSTSGIWIRDKFLKDFQKNKKVFSKRNRGIVKVWKKYGIIGVASLTPLLFTPIGGTAIVVSFGEPLYKIWLYMLAAAVVWSFAVNYALYYLGYLVGIK